MTEEGAEFWDWAVAAYARDGVAGACLALQDDHGQCVPLLLWAAWRSHLEQGVGDGEAAKAADVARIWADAVVAPLRQVRRRLKTELDDGDAAVRLPLREKIKRAELEAERALMRRLSGLSPGKIDTKQGVGEALHVVARAWAPDVPKDGLASLAEALTKA
jgi:uncharacterized protein (TIGR02444 family)